MGLSPQGHEFTSFEAVTRNFGHNERFFTKMVKIRMTRMGSKKSPFYRVIAIDERKQRDGRPLEFLGTYDPRVDPPVVNLNLEGIDSWVAKGAQLSDTAASIVRRVRRTGNTFSNAAGTSAGAEVTGG
jgi:small subunit ribosomal protein S16